MHKLYDIDISDCRNPRWPPFLYIKLYENHTVLIDIPHVFNILPGISNLCPDKIYDKFFDKINFILVICKTNNLGRTIILYIMNSAIYGTRV